MAVKALEVGEGVHHRVLLQPGHHRLWELEPRQPAPAVKVPSEHPHQVSKEGGLRDEELDEEEERPGIVEERHGEEAKNPVLLLVLALVIEGEHGVDDDEGEDGA